MLEPYDRRFGQEFRVFGMKSKTAKLPAGRRVRPWRTGETALRTCCVDDSECALPWVRNWLPAMLVVLALISTTSSVKRSRESP